MDILYLDFETRSRIDLRKCGADVYARHPSTEVMACGYAFNDEPTQIIKMNEDPHGAGIMIHIALEETVIAHNAHFEWLIWNYTWKRKYPDLPELKIEQMKCTMAMAYAMALPGSLENAANAVGLTHQKDLKGQRVMMQLTKPKDGVFYEPESFPDKFESLYQYCKSDIEVERQLYKRLVKMSLAETEIWKLDHKINQRGVQVDIESAKRAMEIVDLEAQRLDLEMRKITADKVESCTAATQLTHWIKNQNVQIDSIAKADLDALLDSELPEDVRAALLLRQEAAKSSTAKLTAMLERACNDQRLRGLFQYHGASTGRWAGRGVQVQNLPRAKLTVKQMEDIFHLLETT